MKKLTLERVLDCIDYKPLIMHHCSFCKYPCSYIIVGGVLGYDVGCDCVTTEFKRLNAGWKPVPDSNLLVYINDELWKVTLTKYCEEVEAEMKDRGLI